jgi:hypothetical protein
VHTDAAKAPKAKKVKKGGAVQTSPTLLYEVLHTHANGDTHAGKAPKAAGKAAKGKAAGKAAKKVGKQTNGAAKTAKSTAKSNAYVNGRSPHVGAITLLMMVGVVVAGFVLTRRDPTRDALVFEEDTDSERTYLGRIATAPPPQQPPNLNNAISTSHAQGSALLSPRRGNTLAEQENTLL